MMRRLLYAVALPAALAATLTAQQAPQPAPPPPSQATPPPVFRVEVNYVEVDAIVTDAQGRVVTDLTAADFELIEDRDPQTISAFSYVDIPIEQLQRPLFASAPIEPDVQTNQAGEGRIYLIVIDSLHIDQANAIKVRNAARQFIERSFGTNDMAAVVFSGRQAKDTQDFTNNKRLLLAAIDKTIGAKPVSATLARMQELQARPGRLPGSGPIADPYEFERALNARNSMDRLRVLSEFMANVRGRRKAMLLISEGVEYQMGDVLASNPASGVLESVRDAIGAATRANVAIYGIDPRGLTDPSSDLTPFGFNPSADDPSLGNLGIRSAIEESRVAQDSLRQLSAETGGFAVLNQNDFASAFERIVADNSSYYVLGYYPTNERRDGRFRRITVRVKRPGLTVRARRGYLAPRGRAPEAPAAAPGTSTLTAAAMEALSSPLPIAGIPMRIVAAPFRGEAPNANVPIALELGADALGLVEDNGTFTGRVEVLLTATDSEAKPRGNATQTFRLGLKPDTMARAREGGIRVLSELALPPGRYQVRAAAVSETGRSGSVIADVEVPDFTAAPMTMSAVALSSASIARTVTIPAKTSLEQLLPGPLTATREFPRGDQLAVFAEFYENVRNVPPHKVDLSVTIRSDDGRVVYQDEEERDSSELQGGAGGYGYSNVLPTSDLAPGLYVIHVEGRSRATAIEAGVGRDIAIRIR